MKSDSFLTVRMWRRMIFSPTKEDPTLIPVYIYSQQRQNLVDRDRCEHLP